MIACYLLYCREFRRAEEALKFFGEKRTMNGRGVTIPSQQRYVHYFERVLRRQVNMKERAVYLIQSIKMNKCTFLKSGPDNIIPYFGIRQRGRTVLEVLVAVWLIFWFRCIILHVLWFVFRNIFDCSYCLIYVLVL